MKNSILILGLFGSLLITSCSKPDAKEILKKSYEKCQSIKNGYYEMTYYMKSMSNKDTSSSSFNCHFKKLPSDSIYSFAFHYQKYIEGEYSGDVLYTGDDFVNYSLKDSSGEIMSKTLWAEDIEKYSHNYTFYLPLTQKQSYPLLEDSVLADTKNVIEFIGEETINNIPCYHIKLVNTPENDSTEMIQTLKVENNYWVNKEDYMLVQYSIAYDLVMNNDTMYQYEKNVLTKYELNNLKNEDPLKLTSIPSYIQLKDYTPYKSPELLPKDTIAPAWSLVSLKDETVKLSDLKGKLVLIDFFYKSCYPCMQALPALERLHQTYHNQGLKMIGIDPYDTKEKDDIDNFLAKRGVTYPVLLGGKDVAKEYHVSGYPTIYLIDKKGKILFSQVGYGEGSEKELEEIIKQNL